MGPGRNGKKASVIRAQREMGSVVRDEVRGALGARSPGISQDEEHGLQPGPWAHRGQWEQWEVRSAEESCQVREKTIGDREEGSGRGAQRGMRSLRGRRSSEHTGRASW